MTKEVLNKTKEIIQGPIPSSSRGKLNWADYLGALRVGFYTVLTSSANYIYEWLHNYNTAGMTWWTVILIGLAIGGLELLRRSSKDYTKVEAKKDNDDTSN